MQDFAHIANFLETNFAKIPNSSQNFIASLLTAFKKEKASEKQIACLLQMYNKLNTATQKPAPIMLGDFAKVVELFQIAHKKLKTLKLRLQLPNGEKIVLSWAGKNSNYPGTINVTDGKPFGENVFYGRISQDGNFEIRVEKAGLIELLHNLANDVVKVATEYGRMTGKCCFCGKGLTDARSVIVGYGLICSEHWGLPWGE